MQEIVRRWHDIQKDLFAFVQEKHKPLFFTEVGWCSLANAAHEPWDYTKTWEPIDLDLHASCMKASSGRGKAEVSLGGYMIWQFAINQGGPERSRLFAGRQTCRASPAAMVRQAAAWRTDANR